MSAAGKTHDDPLAFTPGDREVLRRLASRKAAIAGDPTNDERRRAWHALDAGVGDRVMVLAEQQGLRDPRRPVPEEALRCVGKWARALERTLRTEIWQFEELRDDHVVEPFINVGWRVRAGNYGVDVVMHDGGDEAHMGSRVWDAPIRDLDADFEKLRPRTFTVDRAATLARKAALEDLFGDLIEVRTRGQFYWTMGLTWRASELIGLEGLMLAMYDNPTGLHRLMAFLRDDHLAFADWLEQEGLYSPNNENDYVGSGSVGYTRALPVRDPAGASPVRSRDLWVLGESQETVGVSPAQFEEFVFPYQLEVLARFGRTYYGCCEPLHGRWHIVKRIPNLARVSVSPWADQDFMAGALGHNYVFSRKPNPTLISTDRFDEEAIRADLRKTLEVAGRCRIEIIMKDVHTLNNEPHRLARWVQIAREEVDRHG